MKKPGDRVGAILGGSSEPDKEVEFLGYGVYEGDFDPSSDKSPPVGRVADMLKDVAREHNIPVPTNPRIRLDSGKVVWGCECWWGAEERIRTEIENYKKAGYKIVDVDIDEVRAKHRAEQTKPKED